MMLQTRVPRIGSKAAASRKGAALSPTSCCKLRRSGLKSCLRSASAALRSEQIQLSIGRKQQPVNSTPSDGAFKTHTWVEKVSAQELEVAIASRDRPLVIDFYAAWCGPCVLLSQELEKVAKDLGEKVKVVKLDVDENPELSSQLQIQGLPTMIFVGMDKAKPALRTEGLLPAAAIKEIISREL